MLTFLCVNFRGRVTPPRLEIPVDVFVVVLDVNENGALARIPLNSVAIRKSPNTESNVLLTTG
jgi:hypothetical protein